MVTNSRCRIRVLTAPDSQPTRHRFIVRILCSASPRAGLSRVHCMCPTCHNCVDDDVCPRSPHKGVNRTPDAPAAYPLQWTGQYALASRLVGVYLRTFCHGIDATAEATV